MARLVGDLDHARSSDCKMATRLAESLNAAAKYEFARSRDAVTSRYGAIRLSRVYSRSRRVKVTNLDETKVGRERENAKNDTRVRVRYARCN